MMTAAWMRPTALLLAFLHPFAVAVPAAAAPTLSAPTPSAPTVVAVHWPRPAPSQQVPAAGPPPVMQVRPTFMAPSAEQCSGQIETRERVEGPPANATAAMPGTGAKSRATAEARAEHEAADDRSRLAEARASVGRSAPAEMATKSVPPAGAAAPSASAPAVVQSMPPPRPSNDAPVTGPVTAGMVDDNAAFSEYLAFRQRHTVAHRHRDVRERYLLEVRDERGQPVPDAEVAVSATSGAALWARTDAGGQAWIHPDSFDPSRARFYEVVVRQGQRQATGVLRRGQQSSLEIALNGAAAARPARLDLVFLVDATGSMGDEIDALKRNLRSIVDEVSRLPSRPDVCLGLVAYRDRGDAFLVRSHDLTNDVSGFQGVLDALRADGGGDYPEAMNEAFNETVHRIRWRGDGATRLVVLLADAPPHLDYGGPQYDDDMLAALGKGIKVFSVGASGLDRQGEYIQRQIAQYTGGRFVFLTYDKAAKPSSGPGRETVHDVRNYSVQALDRLIVKLVSDELAKRPRGG